MKEIKNACPRDCYSGCSLILEVEKDRIVKIKGDPENKATRGIICVKGKSYIERNYGDQRLKYPLKRTGKKGEGQFERISWDEAIAEITEKISGYQTEKPESILYYEGAGAMGTVSKGSYGFWNQLKGYTYPYGSLCSSAGQEALIQTYGKVIHNAPWDIANAGCIILWGKNPANTNMQEMQFINEAVKKGGRLVVIDPIRTKSAANSSMHIMTKNGTDAALALALCNYLIVNDMYDKDFVEKYVYGFDEFKEHIQKYTLEFAAEKCGIDTSEIVNLAQIIWNNRPLSLVTGFGIQRYTNGGQTVRALSVIPALIGSVGVKGGGFRYSSHVAPKTVWPYKTDEPERVSKIHVARLGEQILDNEIKMMWVEKVNPAVSNPNTKKVIEALEALEFLVVVEQYMSDTARYADIVLPAAATFEYYDILTSYWNPYLMLVDKVHDPLYECKHESEIYRLLGKNMNMDLKQIPENSEELIRNILNVSNIGVTLEELRKGPYLAEGYNEVAFEDKKFNTVTGKIQFKAKTMKKWHVSLLPEYVPTVEIEDMKYPLIFMSSHSHEKINSQHSNLPMIKKIIGEIKTAVNIKDAEARGIKDGDMIRIFNDRGSVVAKAKVTGGIKQGTVNLYEGFSNFGEANANILTQDRITDIGNGTAFHNCTVEIERVR